MLFRKPLLITKVAVSAALCFSATSAWANPACTGGLAGCVLPVVDAVVAPPPAAAPVVVQDYDEPKSLGILPILGALAIAGLAAWLLLDDDNDDEDDDLPVSP